MNNEVFIAYYRVSTKKQSLGLDAQENEVARFIEASGGILIAEYQEKESGRKDRRPRLQEALEHARRACATLLIAKLDRLSRSVSFIFKLKESGIAFKALDMPELNTMTLGVVAAMAQSEQERISDRTKAALAAKKRAGAILGRPRGSGKGRKSSKQAIEAQKEGHKNAREMHIAPYREFVRGLRTLGASWVRVAAELNKMGAVSTRGGVWSSASAKNSFGDMK